MKYTAIIEQAREPGYVACARALKGFVSQRKTREEVLRNVREAEDDLRTVVALSGTRRILR